MNKLDKGLYDGIKDKYVDKVKPIIKDKYEEFKEVNQEASYMNNTFDLRDIFESNDVVDDVKIENLLTSHLDEMDKNIINYIKTCIFVYWVKNKVYKVNKDIKKYFNAQSSNEAVRKFFECFRNDIIESYIQPNKTYQTMKGLHKLCADIDIDLVKLNAAIRGIVKYDSLYKEGLRDEIIISTGIDICPYCGRQFITKFKDRSSADLDHFFPKKVVPLLSLSLYNFIPSCHICNSRLKNQSINKILYPFDDGYENNAKFTVKYINSITNLYPDIEIEIENISEDKYFETGESIKLFHINEVYQTHNKFISNLLYKEHIYSNSAFKESVKAIIPHELSDEEMNILLFGYSFDLKKDQDKLLAKLVNDIHSLFE